MLKLRPFEKADAEVFTGWIHDEAAFRKWSADRYEAYPVTAEDICRQYAAMDFDSFFPMTAVDESGVVGHLALRFPDAEKKILRFVFVIVDDAKRGMGYGKQMLALAVQYAFEELKAEKITLGVFENNLPAYRCYRAVGFHDVSRKETEYYHIMGEDWKCLELEMDCPALHSHKLTEEEKRKICDWKYEGEYAIYNLPSYEEMRERKQGFCNPLREKNFRAFYFGERLVGFTNLLEEEKEIFLGIGVNPLLCGQGFGQRILKEISRIAKELYPGKPLYLEVRTWNERAVRCYQRAGFRIDGSPFEQKTGIGIGTFYRMVKA